MKYSDMWAWWWFGMSIMFFAQQSWSISLLCVAFSFACKRNIIVKDKDKDE